MGLSGWRKIISWVDVELSRVSQESEMKWAPEVTYIENKAYSVCALFY